MKKYIAILSLAGLLGLTSCNDKLYSDPVNNLTQDQILEVIKRDPTKVLGPMVTGVEAFPGAAGTSVVTYFNIHVFNLVMDLRGNDMVQSQAAGSWYLNEYRMSDFGFRNETAEGNGYYWAQFYAHVYKANQLLDLIPDFEEVNDPEVIKLLKQYKASALTLRAYAYTYLMWIYQDDYLHGGKDKPGVPLYLDAGGEAQGRAPSQDVWNCIISDAQEAVNLFNETGVDPKAAANDFDATVANVVLARAAITVGDWETAINAAKAVIDVYPTLMDETEYTTKGFADLTLNEVILGYDYTQGKQASTSSFHGWMNITNTGGYGGSQGGWFSIDQRLYDQISNTDYRKKNFLAEPQEWTYTGFEPMTHPKYSNYKFSAPAKTETTPDYQQDVIYMRVSEMILLKAEAEARSGNDQAAQQTLYTLAHARDPQYTLSTKTGDELLKEIQLQTRIELWGEGFEYYNNKRWNIGVDRSGSANHTFFPVLAPGKLFTYQIPLNNEINYNPLITEQNPL